MAGNPLIAQGSLNRLRGSIVIPNYPSLNVTASYLSKRGISLELVGDLTLLLNNMTGMTTSPEPYVPCDVTFCLLKTQNLSALWIQQVQDTTVLGNVTVHTDSSAFPHFDLINAAVIRMTRVTFDGTDPVAEFTVRGTYLLNDSLWDLA